MLMIRLSRIGKKKKPFYRVVVIEKTRPRDGRVKEAVGTYDPLKKPAEIKLDAERIKYWMGLGAQPSDTVLQVKSVEGSQVTVLELRVHPEDLGKVIGRQGRTAKAIRTLLGASGMKLRRRFTLEILES